MDSLTITLPHSLHEYVVGRAAALGMESPGDYLRKLVEEDLANHRRTEKLVLEAIEEGGEPIAMDDAWWKERFAKLDQRFGPSNG